MDYYNAFPSFNGYQNMPYEIPAGMASGSMTQCGSIYKGYGQQCISPIRQPMFLEDRILEDMEYLQQMYPTYAKRYQSVIKSAIDKMDYEGSFIYDQYPDKFSIQRMVLGVMEVIRANEEKDGGESGGAAENALTEKAPWAEKEPWIRELVTVVMYYEILGRRKKKQKSYWFM